MITSAFVALATLLVLMTIGWLISLRLHNVGIVDIFWGPAIATAGWVYVLSSQITSIRQLVVLVFLHLWAIRLSIYLARRSWRKPEDKRYQQMRRNRGPSFRWSSLFVVFWLQAGVGWIVSLPLLVSLGSGSSAALGIFDVLGMMLFFTGFTCEVLADWQLTRFNSNPNNAGTVLDRGLWRYSRHPNYFGEALLWWGFWCMSGSFVGGIATIVSPVLVTVLLLKVSGVSMLEKLLTDTKPGYLDYTARTSAFVPWFPKKLPNDVQFET